MKSSIQDTPIGLLLSGGLDSSILLGHLLRTGYRVQPFHIRSNLVWQEDELASIRRFQNQLVEINGFEATSIFDLVIMDLPLDDLYGDHWSVTGTETPSATTSDDAVYLPGRNPLLVIKAALWCSIHQIPQLAIASLAANPFSDAGDQFFAAYESVLNHATCGHGVCGAVQFVRPFAQFSKQEVIELGADLPLEATFSCIHPVDGVHCGRCNKCGERQRAFLSAGMLDPTPYAVLVCV